MIISRATKKAYFEHFFPDHVGAMNEHTTDRIFDGLETMLEHLLHLPANQKESFAFTLGGKFIDQANFILANENLACLLCHHYVPPETATRFSFKEVRDAYKRGFCAGQSKKNQEIT